VAKTAEKKHFADGGVFDEIQSKERPSEPHSGHRADQVPARETLGLKKALALSRRRPCFPGFFADLRLHGWSNLSLIVAVSTVGGWCGRASGPRALAAFTPSATEPRVRRRPAHHLLDLASGGRRSDVVVSASSSAWVVDSDTSFPGPPLPRRRGSDLPFCLCRRRSPGNFRSPRSICRQRPVRRAAWRRLGIQGGVFTRLGILVALILFRWSAFHRAHGAAIIGELEVELEEGFGGRWARTRAADRLAACCCRRWRRLF